MRAESARGGQLLVDSFGVAFDMRRIAVGVAAMAAVFAWAWITMKALGESIILGLFCALGLWVLGSFVHATLTKFCYEGLAGNDAVTVRASAAFAGRHLVTFLLAPVVMYVLLGVAVGVMALVMHLGRIPYLGELFSSLAFLPLVALSFLATVAALFGGLLTYPVVAGEGTGVLGTIARVFEIIRRRAAYVVAYISGGCLASALGLAIALLFLVSAFILAVGLTALGLGSGKAGFILQEYALSALPPAVRDISVLMGIGRPSVPLTMRLARWIFELDVVAIVAAVAVLPYLLITAVSCAVYLGARELPVPRVGRPPEMKPAKRHCIHCGQPIALQARFCIHCGKPQAG